MKSILIRVVCLLLISSPALAFGKKQGPSPWQAQTSSVAEDHAVDALSVMPVLHERHEGTRCARKCTYRPS